MHNEAPTIAVISDTHVNHLCELPSELIPALEKADLIIHLGDYTSKELLDELRRLGKFHGIAGNHDKPHLLGELNNTEVIEVEGRRIGIIHGMIFPFGSQKRMKTLFKKHKIDVLLYGHTHLATSRTVGGVLIFNPGTVTGQSPAYHGSFGLISLNGTIDAEIIPLECHNIPEVGPLRRLWVFFLDKTIRLIETWPYFDVPYYTANIGHSIKRAYFRMPNFLFRRKQL